MIHARNDYQRIQDPANKIPIDEPVFLLRAQDVTAADTVRAWAKANRKLMKAEREKITEEQYASRMKAITLAEAHAYRMDEWTPRKPADA
jgi:hypothetical protein